MEYKVSDFDFKLPTDLIAQKPLEKRENCRMMYINRALKTCENEYFKDILKHFKKDDILVLNDTKVYPARVLTKRKTGAKVEIFLLNPYNNSNVWEALTKNTSKVKEGEIFDVAPDFKIKFLQKQFQKQGEVPKCLVELIYDDKNIYDVLDKYGSIPLPPYITRQANQEDKNDYQTVFAKNIGSCAAPTAGLHFTKELLSKIENLGVKIVYVTLNVGLGTFSPVKTEKIQDHTMHFENYSIPKETADLINNKKGSVIACGTTVLRCLEAQKQKYGKIQEGSYSTNIFIYPPYKIKSIDKLITNFHLPKSTLIMLVSAFIGKDFAFRAYQKAIDEKYRFFSYGDCMFIE